ncbi:MAG: hypothetical protein KBE09_01085 [Candidatus Pacebacteria bacterium]|nr:hypothetical protein [Candidatus Paceibacterota bacterium]
MKKEDKYSPSEDVYRRLVLDAKSFKGELPERTVRELALAERLINRLAWLPYLLTVIGLGVGLFAYAGVCASGASESQLCFCIGLPPVCAGIGAGVAYIINARQYQILIDALRIRHDLIPLLRTSFTGDDALLPVLKRIERRL